MKTRQEITNLYLTELLPTLKTIDKQRISILIKMFFAILIIVGLYFLVSINLKSGDDNADVWLVGFIISAFVFGVLYSPYKKRFKSKVIRRIIHFIDKSLIYESNQHISQSDFENSCLFTHPDEYEGDDRIRGSHKGRNFYLSEVKAVRVYGYGRKKIRKKIFKGLFFKAGFNKSFKGQTLIYPDFAERFLGFVGTKFQKIFTFKGELVKLENPEFEKYFAVYSENQIEARYILSVSLMQRILDYRKKARKKVFISFTNNNINIAIPHSKDLFEPRLFRSIVSFEMIMGFYETLELMLGIVEDLDLNNDLWN